MPITLPPAVNSLERRLGLPEDSLQGEDLARAQEALDDATTLVLAEVSTTTATAWAADAPKVVVLVILKAARREFENPRGLQQESLGEHSVGLTDTSGVYLTPREIAQVQRAASGNRSPRAGTVRIRNPFEEAQ